MGRHIIALFFVIVGVALVQTDRRLPLIVGVVVGYGVAELGRWYWGRGMHGE
jgi:hypothetical protein